MYFLSHFFVDRNRNDPYFAVGTLIPDLATGFTKTYNSKIRNKSFDIKGNEAAIHQGILRHFELDKIFHTSPLFLHHCEKAKQQLIYSQLNRDRLRLSVIAHLGVEMLLDHWLILNFEGIVTSYYKLLQQVDVEILNSYLDKILPEVGKQRFLSNFMRFKEVEFLKYLEKPDGTVTGIVKTYEMATGVVFEKEEEEKLLRALHNIKNDMRYSSEKLLDLNISGR